MTAKLKNVIHPREGRVSNLFRITPEWGELLDLFDFTVQTPKMFINSYFGSDEST